MEVRGAPLIGGTAAYGIVLAIQESSNKEFVYLGVTLNQNLDLMVRLMFFIQ